MTIEKLMALLWLFIDDILLVVGMIFICIAAFRFEFEVGLLMLGICFVLLAILAGRR
ncbi:DUF1056 family protein [Macrococcus equipercicus]|uniref:DUF1056 family protein n=1 Tax=Macrococcus equipercicus TaxID=69967 RepID=A0ABQ6R7X5_9STAP|nr:DUF1056 family protein [Macrococcus equipercicus]